MSDARGMTPPDLTQSLERMRAALSRSRPGLLATLNPPASDQDIERLARAIDPIPVPAALETWFRFADGQLWSTGWWPVFNGPLLGIDEAISLYSVGVEFQPRRLFPLSYESHAQISIDLLAGADSPLIDTTVSSTEWRIVAPSLAAAALVVAELVEDDALGEWPIEMTDFDGYQAKHAALAERVDSRMKRFDASALPFPIGQWFEAMDGPWGPFPT